MIKEVSPQRFSNDPWDADASSTANYCGGSVMEGQEQPTATLTHTHTHTAERPADRQQQDIIRPNTRDRIRNSGFFVPKNTNFSVAKSD